MTTLPQLTVGGAAVSTDIFAVRESGGTVDKSKTLAQVKTLITTTANQLAVTASGTVYSLTNAAAAIDFGTIDPALTITATGIYLIMADVVINYNGATFAATQDVTIKLRRTNNTPADLTGGTRVVKASIVTTITGTLAQVSFAAEPYATSNVDDAIALYGLVATTPAAGSLDIISASIRAIRLQQ